MSERANWAVDVGNERWLRPVEMKDHELNLLRRDNSLVFHNMMAAAMVQNGFKYGDIADAYPDRVDAMRSAQERIEMYAHDGNVRWLVDAANFLMCEFTHPRDPQAHLGEDRSIGRVVPGVGEFTEKSNAELTGGYQYGRRAGD